MTKARECVNINDLLFRVAFRFTLYIQHLHERNERMKK